MPESAPRHEEAPNSQLVAGSSAAHESRLLRVMRGLDTSLTGLLIAGGLRCLQPFYYLAVTCRNATFDLGWRKVAKLGRPTISVGNLTTGGTGKTPMVMELVQRLRALDQKPAILLRGYMSTPDPNDPGARLSDEAEVYRKTFGDEVPVEANPDRRLGAAKVLQAEPSVTCFVLDDGFQHRKAHRDLDIVLRDATQGAGHLLPRGFLREPLSSQKRADLIILTHWDDADASQQATMLDELHRWQQAHFQGAHPPKSSHVWTGYLDQNDQPIGLEALNEKRVVGVCGIGHPAPFVDALNRHTAGAVACEVMADHFTYDDGWLKQFASRSTQGGAQAIVTTEKDYVKWKPRLPDCPLPLPTYRPVLALEIEDPDGIIDREIASMFAGQSEGDAKAR